jgi:hypothetical protein
MRVVNGTVVTGRRLLVFALVAIWAVALFGPLSPAAGDSPAISNAVDSTATGDELSPESGKRLVDTHGEPMAFHGGYVQHHPHVYLVFWGSDWNNLQSARNDVLELYRALPGSDYGAILTQYFDYSGPIANDTALTSFTDTRTAHPAETTEEKVRNEVHYAIQHDSSWQAAWEAPNRYENQYVVITPPETVNHATEGCGYHGWDAKSWQVSFTYILWPPEGCLRGLSAGHALQKVASHEWAESATDPIPYNWAAEGADPALIGWTWGQNGEIGDVCQTLSPAEHKEIAPGIFAQTLYDNFLLVANETPCVVADPSPQRYTAGMGQVSVSTASHSAILSGQLSPAGWLAGYRFELTGPGGTTFLPSRQGQEPIQIGYPPSLESAGSSLFSNLNPTVQAEGLKGNTVYSARFSTLGLLTDEAYFNFGQDTSSMFGGSTQFTTPDWRPQITGPSQGEVKAGHAILSANINPEGYGTTYRFEWGKTTSYGNSIPVPDASIGPGTSNVAVEQKLEGLKGLTEYHYRIVASNAEGTTTSADKSFTTPDWRPALNTNAQTWKPGHVTLHGKVNPKGFATHYRFEWGTDAEYKEGKYGHLVPAPDAEVGSGESDVTVQQLAEGMKGLTTYHFHLVAENEQGKTTDADKSFTTPDWAPGIQGVSGVGVGREEATLVARIDPNNFATTYRFEWGTQKEFEEGKYGNSFGESLSAGEGFIEVSHALKGLKLRSTYHFRVIAENAEGTSNSGDRSFTTETSRLETGNEELVYLTGTPTTPFNLTLAGARAECNGPSFETSLWPPTEQLSIGSIEFPSCTWLGSAVPMNMNGCHYELHPGYGTKSSFAGEFDIGPPGCGPITTNLGMCQISIPAQIGRAAHFENEGTGTGRKVKVNLEVEDLRYTQNSGACATGTKSDGAYSGTWQIQGKNKLNEAVPVYVNPLYNFGPELVTEGASAVSATGATLHGSVNTMGFASYYGFEYGLTAGSEYESTISGGEVPAGVEGFHAKELTVGNLKPGRTYHYRIAAFNGNGISFGEDHTFTTAPGTITTEATVTSASGATLRGSINPGGVETSYQFEYGATTSYGSKVPASPKAIGSGKEFVAVSEPITGLSPSSTYHFRVVSTNSEGATYGEDKTFTTWGSWSTQTTPNLIQSTTETRLEGVSCASSTMCMGVGNDLYTGMATGQLWNGTEWKTLFSRIEGTLYGVSCPTASFCAVAGKTAAGTPKAETWTKAGSLWSKGGATTVATPSGGTEVELRGVSCSSESACTAVGSYTKEGVRKSLAERYNGTEWTIQTSANPESEGAELLGVSCDSSTSCTAVGKQGSTSISPKTLAERWNGTSWSISTTPNQSGVEATALEKVSCTSGSFCLAVGYYREGFNRWAYTARWNGSEWTAQAAAKPSGSKASALLGVSCTSSSACIAVGRYVTASTTGDFGATEEKTLAESWGGSEWALQTSTNPEGKKLPRLTGVSCTASNACSAVGWAKKGSGEAEATTLGEGWNGSSWSTQTTPNLIQSTTETRLEGVSCASSTMCMGVGNDLYTGMATGQLWNGTEWNTVLSRVEGTVYGVSCPTASFCAVAGKVASGAPKAELWTKIGSKWVGGGGTAPAPSGATEVQLRGVSCTSESACTAVGSYFTKEGAKKTLAERWNGSEWAIQTTANPESGPAELLGVSCDSATSCTAVGTQDLKTLAERWNGTSWSISTTPNQSGAETTALEKVSCTSGSFCLAVGNYKKEGGRWAFAERWNGSEWQAQSVPNPTGAKSSSLLGVSCTSSSACTSVGRYVIASISGEFLITEEGTLAESWDGSKWAVQSSPNPSGKKKSLLTGVSCISASACSAVGLARKSSSEAEVTTLGERYE